MTGVHHSTILLQSVAEQLKVPLSLIARQAELGRLTGSVQPIDLTVIQTQAQAALTIIDSYLLGIQLIEQQATLPLEPVSVSALLVDVAHELSRLAPQYDTKVRLHVGGKYEPVMAHHGGLRAALLSVGHALLEGYPLHRGSLTLAVHKNPHGIVTGLYGAYEQLSVESWRRAGQLHGRARQPLPSACQGAAAGLFVADGILQAMASGLRVGKHQGLRGMAATFQPSRQLQFV